jgi:hypothetical protein
LTFDQCELTSGELLNGSLTLDLVLSPYVGISLTCGEITIDDKRLDGWMGLAASGPVEDLTISVGIDMSFEDATSRLDFQETVLALKADLAYIDGQGYAAVDSQQAAFEADQLIWYFADCLPSSGSLSLDMGIPVRVTFTADTPATGIVLVEIGGMGPFEEPMFPPCQ